MANRKDQLKKQNESPYELSELVQDINYPYFEENKLPRSRQCILRVSVISLFFYIYRRIRSNHFAIITFLVL